MLLRPGSMQSADAVLLFDCRFFGGLVANSNKSNSSHFFYVHQCGDFWIRTERSFFWVACTSEVENVPISMVTVLLHVQ